MDDPGLRVGISPTLGIRGVLACRDFRKGEEIERCPVLLLPIREWEDLRNTAILRYYYEWNKNNHALVLGYGSLYNHSYEPNARYTFCYKTKEFTVRAIKHIKCGEEVFVNYNYEPDCKDPLPPWLTDFDGGGE